MKKVIIGIIAMLILIALVISNKKPEKTNGKPVVKIGVTIPLISSAGVMGENVKYGIELAQEDLKGKTELQYNVIFENDDFDPKKTVSIFRKFIFLDKVNALISTGANTGQAVSPIALKNKIFHINVVSSSQFVANGKTNFLHWPQPSKESEVLVNEYKKRGVKKIIAIVQQHAGAEAIYNAVEPLLKKENIEFEVIRPTQGETDFRLAMKEITDYDPDSILLLLLPPSLEIFVKQKQEAKLNTNLSSVEIFGLVEDKDSFNDYWYVDVPDGSSRMLDRFNKKAKDGSVYGMAYGYDAFDLIVKCFESFYKKTGKVATGEELADEMFFIENYSSAVGPISVEKSGLIDSEAVVKIIRNGKVELLEE